MSTSRSAEELFAKRLRGAREMRGLSQADLGAKTGLQPAAVSHFETGARRPSFDNLRRLAMALEVSTDYLLGRVESPEGSAGADVAFRDYQKLSDRDRQVVQGVIAQMTGNASVIEEPLLAKRAPPKEPVPRGKKRT